MNRCDVAFVRKVGFRQRALLGLDVFESSPKQLIQVLNRVAALLDRVPVGFAFDGDEAGVVVLLQRAQQFGPVDAATP